MAESGRLIHLAVGEAALGHPKPQGVAVVRHEVLGVGDGGVGDEGVGSEGVLNERVLNERVIDWE